MPRETYELSDATREVLTDRVKPIAAAWNKAERWIYRILEGSANDAFAYFLPMYAAAAKAGISRRPWRDELDFIDQRYAEKQDARTRTICFKGKLKSHNVTIERYMEFLEDGELDAAETQQLERLLQKEQDAIDLLRQALKIKRESGLKAV